MLINVTELLNPIRQLHERIRDEIISACEATTVDELATIANASKTNISAPAASCMS